MSPEERCEAATELMLDAARDIEARKIWGRLYDQGVRYTSTDVNVIQELVSTATITVEWPDGGGSGG